MAEQRLELLMKKTEARYAAGSPLLLEACALYLDKATNTCVAQLKWKNIDPRTIKAVMIELECYDAFNQKIESVRHQYDGILMDRGSEFGSRDPIVINHNKAVRFDALLKAVSFTDGNVWRAEEGTSLEALPADKPQSLTGETLEQFVRDLAKTGNKNAALLCPQTDRGLWQCGCGSWQYRDTPCLKCGMTQETLTGMLDETVLVQHLIQYQQEQEKLQAEAKKKAEEARIAREKSEADKREKEAAEKNRREQQMREDEVRLSAEKTKKKKTGIIVAAVLVLLAAAVVFLTQSVIPGNHYSKAETAYLNKRYLEAYDGFLQAGNYKDADVQAKRSAYAYAEELRGQGLYEPAYNYFTKAEDYNDARAQSLDTAKLYAQQYRDQFDYSNAATWYGVAGLNEDKAEMLLHAKAGTAARFKSINASQRYNDLLIGVYEYHLKDSEKFGLIGTDNHGWITDAVFSDKPYYNAEQKTVYAYGNGICTAVNLETGSRADLTDCKKIVGVSKYGITYMTNDSQYKAVTPDGEMLFETVYENMGNFADDLCPVQKDGKYGYIDPKGNVVIDFKFDRAGNFKNGVALIYMNERKIKEGDMYVTYNAGWGMIDKTGREVIKPEWDQIDNEDNYILNGVVRVSRKKDKYDYYYGLISLTGKTILPTQYDIISEFSDGVVYIQKTGGNYSAVESRFITADGETVLNVLKCGRNVYSVNSYVKAIDGLASIRYMHNDSVTSTYDMLIDLNGNVLLEKMYHISVYSRDQIYVQQKMKGDTVYYKLTEAGSLVTTSGSGVSQSAFMKQWGKVYSFTEEGIAKVALNSHKNSYKSSNGETTYTLEGDPPYGYITKDETILVDPVYQAADDYHNGYASVKPDGELWGIIDTRGEYVIQPKYYSIGKVSKAGTVLVCAEPKKEKATDSQRYMLVNMNDEVLVKNIIYDYNVIANDYQYVMKVSENRTTVWRIYNSNGERLF